MRCGKPTRSRVKESSSFSSREFAFFYLLGEPFLQEAIQPPNHILTQSLFLYRKDQEIRFDFFGA